MFELLKMKIRMGEDFNNTKAIIFLKKISEKKKKINLLEIYVW